MFFFDCNYWLKDNKLIDLKLSGEFKNNSINKVIVSNSYSLLYDPESGNNELIKNPTLRKQDNIFYSFILTPEFWIKFNFNKYVIDLFKNKVRLFRFFPKTHLYYINDHYMENIFGVLNDLKFPVMMDLKQFDITGNKYFAMDDITKILSNNPQLPVILECSLKQLFFNRFLFPLLEQYKNLYIEISKLFLIEQIEEIISRFGSKRLIFGTSYPDLEKEFSIGRVILADLDETEKRNISCNNINNIIRRIKIDG